MRLRGKSSRQVLYSIVSHYFENSTKYFTFTEISRTILIALQFLLIFYNFLLPIVHCSFIFSSFMICFENPPSKAHKCIALLQIFFMNFYTFFIAFFSLILHNTFVRFQKGRKINMSSAADAAGFVDWCLLCGCQKSERRLSKSLFCRMVTVIGDEYRETHTDEKGLLVACGQFLFLQFFTGFSACDGSLRRHDFPPPQCKKPSGM